MCYYCNYVGRQVCGSASWLDVSVYVLLICLIVVVAYSLVTLHLAGGSGPGHCLCCVSIHFVSVWLSLAWRWAHPCLLDRLVALFCFVCSLASLTVQDFLVVVSLPFLSLFWRSSLSSWRVNCINQFDRELYDGMGGVRYLYEYLSLMSSFCHICMV